MLSQDKKGLSIMIGYVLLIAIAIIMSLVVYQFIKTYIPREALECPDGVSVFITEAKYICDPPHTLEVTIKNNGLFNVAGYFIRATAKVGQELATLDLSDLVDNEDYKDYPGSVVFPNDITPNKEKPARFDLSGLVNLENHKIEIIPVRWQEEEGKMRFASCSDAKVGEVLSCWVEPEVCEPDCTGECGDDNCDPYDVTDCGDCGLLYPGEGLVCDVDGVCVDCTPDCSCALTLCVDETCIDPVCDTYCEGIIEPDCTGPDGIEGTADDLVCGPAPNGCGGDDACGTCETGTCNDDGVCVVSFCGDGAIQTPNDDGQNEECDDGGTVSGDGCSSTCIVEAGWMCDDTEPNNICIVDITYTCTNYCEDLEWETGICTSNEGQCTRIPGNVMGRGTDFYCTGDSETGYYCCCFNL